MPMKGGSKNHVPFVECPVCGERCEVKLSKKGFPYFHCASCQMQVFMRSPIGAKRLANIIKRKEMKI